jgi:hypothetical protein
MAMKKGLFHCINKSKYNDSDHEHSGPWRFKERYKQLRQDNEDKSRVC